MAGRYPSLHLISRFQSEIDRLFGEAMAMGEVEMPALEWQPAIDLVETADAVLLLAEVHGIAAAELRVEVKGMRVTISGVKSSAPPGAESPRFLCVERGQGRFAREVVLVSPVNSHAGTARLADGLLSVTFPRVEEKRQAARILQITENQSTESQTTESTEDQREDERGERGTR